MINWMGCLKTRPTLFKCLQKNLSESWFNWWICMFFSCFSSYNCQNIKYTNHNVAKLKAMPYEQRKAADSLPLQFFLDSFKTVKVIIFVVCWSADFFLLHRKKSCFKHVSLPDSYTDSNRRCSLPELCKKNLVKRTRLTVRITLGTQMKLFAGKQKKVPTRFATHCGFS